MSSSKRQKSSSKEDARRNRAAEVANTFEWLITAFILAFLFRAFVMEAFRIPTGSMADTLKGAHFRLCCPQCGYKYDYGLGNYGLPRDTMPRGPLKSMPSRCPSCGWHQPTGGRMPIANGDRILVLKCIYQFLEPKRWDVVVFKNPLDPAENYIKRLIALPEETVEIIDGDVYVDGQIRRKPPKVQNGLWMLIYDNDYRPVRPEKPLWGGRKWQQLFKTTGSKWEIDKANPTLFHLDSPAEQINTIAYESAIGDEFRATYAYDAVREYRYMPYCSDLMVRFYLRPTDSYGSIGISLSKYQTSYKAWIDFKGEMVLAKLTEGKETILDSRPIRPPATNGAALVKFANVDHQLIFEFGKEKLTWDLGRAPDDAGPRKTDIRPQVKIFGSGKLTLSHVAIYRDIHYTAKKYANSTEFGRATEGNAFTLGRDQFFVLGDNSPNSEDGRWWKKEGIGNNDVTYREGIVPRDYLVGKALFVYWPTGFRPYRKFPFGVIPNVGQMRFIYGGSNKKP